MKLKIKHDTFVDEINGQINNVRPNFEQGFMVQVTEFGATTNWISSSRLVDFDFGKYLRDKIVADAFNLNLARTQIEFIFSPKTTKLNQNLIDVINIWIDLFAKIEDWEILANGNMLITAKVHDWVKDFEVTLHST